MVTITLLHIPNLLGWVNRIVVLIQTSFDPAVACGDFFKPQLNITVLPLCFIGLEVPWYLCVHIRKLLWTHYHTHNIKNILWLWDKRKCLHWDLYNRNWSAIVDSTCTENSSQLFSTAILQGGQKQWLKDTLGGPLRNTEVCDPQKFSCIVWKKIMPTKAKDKECIKGHIWPSNKILMGNNMVSHTIWC